MSGRKRIRYRVGTASWTDPTLLESGFYPPSANTAAARLQYYAAHFDTVEVDSTFYALPSERNSYLWAQRTPEDFLFHIKAFAALTQHPVELRQLPLAVRERLGGEAKPTEPGQRVKVDSSEALELCFSMFAAALSPLERAGKLGCLLFQFPPWFTAREENERYLDYCRARLPTYRLAIEFRHRSWFGERAEHTLAFLHERGLVHVILDLPAAPSLPATPFASTSDMAYVRLHGRNREAWFGRHERASERFRYLYSNEELTELAQKIRRLRGATEVQVIFNNCYSDYGVRNALTMTKLLREEP
jgi:uncharacterized protein YecE (DUF72 family)